MQVWVQRERPGQNLQQRRKSIVPKGSSEFVIDLPSKSVWVDGDKLTQLSSEELGALEYLLQNRGQMVTARDIATAVWPGRPNPKERIAQTLGLRDNDSRLLIGNLRRKIEIDPRYPEIICSDGYFCYSIPGRPDVQLTEVECESERQVAPEAQHNSRRIPPPY